ncbi:hypothetical protein, variant [Spizellomyces punctatus DAOM BR117]|uniref:Cyclic nucleotide-binding domain-containing protein n=1 Tax=Spizellomyces punctatus (strain DAOM BR117) TaxID=645134 RepID=A0A0L0H937_SPIPD|nr:hypothetical protein, variant [Spizellomyces punctatus DAOM BR117]KNC97168.1 hypothetical protein, variant [Spizellomyces punctatus DAOM BR117]|eukprot:XP_016605208.1 hypothetical protein, variant [Spizellomyces punctatus DAOM BR117]
MTAAMQRSFSSELHDLGIPTVDVKTLATRIKEQDATINSLREQLKNSESECSRLRSINKILRDRLALVVTLQDQLRGTLKAYDEISERVQEHLRLTQQLQSLVDITTGNVQTAFQTIPTIADLDKMVEGVTEATPVVRTLTGSPRRRNTGVTAIPPPTIDSVISLLSIFPLFAEFPREVLVRLAQSSYEMRRSPGQNIITKGEMGAEIFFLEEGQVNVMATLSDGQDIPLATLTAKAFFGELGVLFGNPRTASVQTKTDCVLVAVTKQKIDEVLQTYPELQLKLRAFADDRVKWCDTRSYKAGFGGEFITNIARKDVSKLPIFSDASDEFIEQLGKRLTPEIFPAAATIIAKGDDSDCIFFIVRGSVQVLDANSNEIHAEMSAGSFFGELGVVLNVQRTASIKAKEECYLLKLTKASLTEVQDLYPAMKQKIQDAVDERYALYKTRTQITNKAPEQFHMEVGHQQLTKLSIFQDIDDNIVSELALLMSQKSWKGGEYIIKCGDQANSMFFLASGEVDVIGEFGEQIDSAKGPDAWFGEVGLLQDVPRTASVRARTDCSTFLLRKEDFMASLRKHPSIASRIEETARERLQAHLMRSILA